MGLLDFIPLVGSAVEAWANQDAQHRANRTNIKLQREQQAWEKDMSNTAIQRRAADIEAAGGNRALAFTNGSEASTPTVAPARVDPARYDSKGLTSGIMAKAQLANIQADTAAKLAEATSKQVQARIDAAGEASKKEFTINRNVEAYEWDDLKTKILRHQDVSTAAEAKRLRETVDQMVAMAKQNAETGQLNLDALRNIARVGGIEASRMKDILKLIIDLATR